MRFFFNIAHPSPPQGTWWMTSVVGDWLHKALSPMAVHPPNPRDGERENTQYEARN